jgi:hypothetical protein
MPLRTLLALLLLVVPARAQNPARCDGEAIEDRLRRVEAHGDLATDGGRLLKLADIRLADAAAAELAPHAGERVAVSLLGGGDRWGRLPARVVLARDGTDLAQLLLQEGLAVVDVGEGDGLCRPALLAAEVAARRDRRGVWPSMLLRATDLGGLAARIGQFAVVEGRIVSVGERARRTYLNFGRDFSRDFTVSIARRDWASMRHAGLSAERLRGRGVRVRGIVEMRRGPSMEVTSAQAIELLPEGGVDR